MSDPASNLSGPPTHSSMHNQINDVVEAIEAELGLNPSSASATVAARLTAIDAAIARPGALTAWTPVITQSGNVTCTVVRAVYTRLGRWISGMFYVNITGTGTVSTNITISLPVTAVGTMDGYYVGTGKIFDASSGSEWVSALALKSTTTMQYQVVLGGGAPVYLGTPSYFSGPLASGDSCVGQFQYEAAAD